MADPFLGEIRMFGGNFAPTNWALCNGQLMSISQYSALFAILGTFYGGNGVQNFALPNMQGRVPIHWGNGLGLSPYVIGQVGGTENVSLTTQQLPAHTHMVNANNGAATGGSPSGAALATVTPPRGQTATLTYAAAPDGSTQMNPQTIALNGGNQPHANIQPYLCVTFIIALNGIFPSRN